MDANTEVLIGLGLFVASELIGMSKLKANGVLNLALDIATKAFPYELKRREEPRTRTPARRRTTKAQ